jgi:hypothetical protein
LRRADCQSAKQQVANLRYDKTHSQIVPNLGSGLFRRED